MENIQNLAQIVTIILVGIFVTTYLILKKNGVRKAILEGGILKNSLSLYRLSKNKENRKLKFSYLALAVAMPIFIMFYLLLGFNLFSEFMNRDDCEYRKNFKNEKWNGIVVAKYFDEKNHNYKTIVLNDKKNSKIQHGILSKFNNYELIKIGDSISKSKDELFVVLYNNEKTIKLKSEFNCTE